MATYLEGYQAYLEGIMADGGDTQAMEAAVREYNAIGNPDYKPRPAFLAWLKAAEHTCAACSREFRAADVASPRAETTCAECLSDSTTRVEPQGASDARTRVGQDPGSDAGR